MSVDNGLIIRLNKNGKYVLQEYIASEDDYPDLESADENNIYNTLEEVILAAAEFERNNVVEYGLKIDLTEKKKEEDPINMETTKFVRKPFEVEAVQVTAENITQVAAWCDGTVERRGEEGKDDRYIRVRVHYPLTEKQTQAFIGNWVLYSGKGYKVYTDVAFRKNFIPSENSK